MDSLIGFLLCGSGSWMNGARATRFAASYYTRLGANSKLNVPAIGVWRLPCTPRADFLLKIIASPETLLRIRSSEITASAMCSQPGVGGEAETWSGQV
jgi:hypothetical protein